ncbi:hypothetical protein [Streptomyces sp. NPDC014894]|uniref:hypothetical protein n=1 Tax=Streptomyces sp. NPDC014894 TaxID=3364931 RepID=UPI0036F70A78
MRKPADHGEEELRVLLERATPRLAAPEGRLREVRLRVLRRRRRRTGAAVLTVSALAVAGTTVLPAALRNESPGPVPPAASAPVRESGPPAHATPSPAPLDGNVSSVGFPGLGGVEIALPRSWGVVAVPADAALKSPALGFAGTQKFTGFVRPCGSAKPIDCAPVKKLGPGDVLIRLSAGQKTTDAAVRGPNPVSAVNGFCELVGGSVSRQVKAPDPRTAFTVCVAGGVSEKTLKTAQQILDSAGFSDLPAPAAPLPAELAEQQRPRASR